MNYSPHQYAEVLRELAKETTPARRREMLRRFLSVLRRHAALHLLPEIERAFAAAKNRERGVREVLVSAPERLPAGAVARKLPFRRAEVRSIADPSILGGAVISVGDVRVDASAALRIRRLRAALMN